MKLSPQPHSPLALGFWNLKASFRPCFTKSTSGAVDQRQAGRIHHDFDAAGLENRVIGLNFVGIIHDIGETGATGFLDAHPQADAGAALRQVRSDPIGRRFRQQ